MALVGIWHRDPELVASQTPASVGGANCSLQLRSQDSDRLVADVMAVRVVDLLEVVEVDHHQRQPALVALRCRYGSVDRSLELGPVGEPREVVGPRLFRVLARAIQRHRDLVSDGGDELEVAGLEGSGQSRGHRHGAKEHALCPQLRTDRTPLASDAVDPRLGLPRSDLDHAHASAQPARLEFLLLTGLKAHGLGQRQPRSFACPDGSGLQAQYLQCLA